MVHLTGKKKIIRKHRVSLFRSVRVGANIKADIQIVVPDQMIAPEITVMVAVRAVPRVAAVTEEHLHQQVPMLIP